MKRLGIRGAAGLALLLAFATAPARALTDEEVYRNLSFNFTNPGARAMALGGAFVAEADDAAAVQANPAAMHYINRWEVFVEYRSLQPEAPVVPRTELGSAAPVLPGDPPSAYLDLQSAFTSEDSSSPSFISVVFPFQIREHKARLALSRHQVLDTETLIPAGQSGYRIGDPSYPDVWVNSRDYEPGEERLERYTVLTGATGALQSELLNYNLAFSYSVTDFSFGVSASYQTVDLVSNVTTATDDPLGMTSNPRDPLAGQPLPIRYSDANGSDSALSYTVGIHWHPDTVFGEGVISPWRFGAVFRKGAKLEIPLTLQTWNGSSFDSEQRVNTFKVPDRYAIGAAYHSEGNWVFTAEAERIKYSDLLENFQSRINFLTDEFGTDPATLEEREITFNVEDATLFRFGTEFNVSTGSVLHQFRAGYYTSPDSTIYLERFALPGAASDPLEPAMKAVFPQGEDEDHFTGGYALTWLRTGYVFQIAADIGDTSEEYVASMIFRFGRLR